MSTTIQLNNGTLTCTPTNGCVYGGGVADCTTPIYANAQVGGSAGSTPLSGSGVGVSSVTFAYYVGDAGDIAGVISSGTWTVPLRIGTMTKPITLDSVYITRANSSGTPLAAIGSATGLSTSLALGLQTFNVSGASTTFGAGDIVVVSFQGHATASASFNATPSDAITAPNVGGSSGIVPAPRVWQSKPRARESRTTLTRVLAPPPTRNAGIAPKVTQSRTRRKRGGRVQRAWLPPFHTTTSPGIAPTVRQWRKKGRERRTVLRVVMAPRTATWAYGGYTILLNSGLDAHIPTLKFRAPGWTEDTHQLYVGDGVTNRRVGGEFVAVPAHSGSAGVTGQEAWDGTYYYKCVAANTWIRLSGTTF